MMWILGWNILECSRSRPRMAHLVHLQGETRAVRKISNTTFYQNQPRVNSWYSIRLNFLTKTAFHVTSSRTWKWTVTPQMHWVRIHSVVWRKDGVPACCGELCGNLQVFQTRCHQKTTRTTRGKASRGRGAEFRRGNLRLFISQRAQAKTDSELHGPSTHDRQPPSGQRGRLDSGSSWRELFCATNYPSGSEFPGQISFCDWSDERRNPGRGTSLSPPRCEAWRSECFMQNVYLLYHAGRHL